MEFLLSGILVLALKPNKIYYTLSTIHLVLSEEVDPDVIKI